MGSVLSSRRATRIAHARFLRVLCPVLASGCGVPAARPADDGVADVASAQDTMPDPRVDGGSDASAIDAGTDVGANETGTDSSVVDAPDVINADASDRADVPQVDVPATVDPRLLGTFHLGTDVEFVLLIEPDGTFRWRRSDCVATDNDCGRWTVDGADIVLSPAPGRVSFDWFATAFRESASVVRLAPGAAPSEVALRGMIGARGPRPFEQTWTRGRVCAVCADGGSAGAAVECAEPVPACTH